MCEASRNLSPPYLTEGNAPPAKLDLEEVAVVRGSEQHDLVLERLARLVVLEDRRAHRFRLTLLVFARCQDGAYSSTLIGPQPLLECLSVASAITALASSRMGPVDR